MAFKLNNPPYTVDNTPIYHVDMEDGVMGKANNNGTIIINKDVPINKIQDVINHEKVHAKNLPWEDEAYKNA
jgi:hypothetical protein